MQARWTFGANDPDGMGWVTAVAYLVVALVCWVAASAARQSPVPCNGRASGLWGGVAILLAILGLNKQLDLQTPFTCLMSNLAHTEGWYGLRWVLKWGFVGGLGLVGIAVLVWVLWPLREAWRSMAPLGLGLVILILYIGIRASPMQGANRMLGGEDPRVGDKRDLVELSGLFLVAAGAAVAVRTIRGGR